MMLGLTPKQGDLLRSTVSLCEGRVGADSIYGVLHRECFTLFPDEMFADLFTDVGRRSVPPMIVAVVMVLQRIEGCSDREAVDRFAFDARWKYAAGGLDFDYPGFVHTVLVDMRARLAASASPDRIFEVTLEAAKKAGLVGRKRVLDSTPLYDAVATMDTVTLIRSGTYATSLKLWLQFFEPLGVAVDEATVENVSRFVGWLRAPAENVAVLDIGTGRCCAATVNRHLAALFSFYDFRARGGVVLAQSLVDWRRTNRGGYRPFLHHVTAGRATATRPLRLRPPRRLPRTLTDEQVLALVEACEHLRDRFLLVLLAETGMRIGQALGLRHADFVSHRKEVRIVPRRDNANGARAKTLEEHTIPISSGLVRLYSGYMFEEYGDCDSDYVFVNLFAQPYGRPLTYQGVHQLVRRLRARTGIWFTLHMLRHSRATNLLRNGVGVDVVARLLTHRSSSTTSQTYVHLNVDDLRAELTRSGAWGKQDQS